MVLMVKIFYKCFEASGIVASVTAVPAHCQNRKRHPGKTCFCLPAHSSYIRKLKMSLLF